MNAVVITCIGRETTFRYCLESAERYCANHGLALELITTAKYGMRGDDKYNYLNFEKNQTGALFDRYDRILRLDCDILIAPWCPNVFDLVPEQMLGAVYEDVGPKREARLVQIAAAQRELGDADWHEGYFNSGVVVASRCHRELFELSEHDMRTIPLWKHITRSKEQTLLNHRVRKTNTGIHALDFRFNHMKFFGEEWNGSPALLDSYIAHFAGAQDSKPHDMFLNWQAMIERLARQRTKSRLDEKE